MFCNIAFKRIIRGISKQNIFENQKTSTQNIKYLPSSFLIGFQIFQKRFNFSLHSSVTGPHITASNSPVPQTLTCDSEIKTNFEHLNPIPALNNAVKISKNWLQYATVLQTRDIFCFEDCNTNQLSDNNINKNGLEVLKNAVYIRQGDNWQNI